MSATDVGCNRGSSVKNAYLALLLATASLGGCDAVNGLYKGKVDCLSESGQLAAVAIVKERAEKKIRETGDESNPLSKSKIRAALAQVKFLFEDVRTSKEDPNSTKKFCAGTLKIAFPTEMITESEKARELMSLDNLTKYADQKDIRRDANTFRIDVDFNVQPTDDGIKVYAEIEDGDPVYSLVTEVVAGQLYEKRISQAKAEEKQRVDNEQQQQEAALAEQRQANYEEAKAANQLAEQSINAVWGTLPQDVRQQVLPLQRAWIKSKDADCKVEAAGVSTEPTEREISRLQCQAKRNNERAADLRSLAERTSYTETY